MFSLSAPLLTLDLQGFCESKGIITSFIHDNASDLIYPSWRKQAMGRLAGSRDEQGWARLMDAESRVILESMDISLRLGEACLQFAY